MAKPNILMLGWEFPPFLSGGLGVACEGLGCALAQKTDLTFILPRSQTSSYYAKIRLIGLNQNAHHQLADFSSWDDIPSELHPYLHSKAAPSEELYGPNLGSKVVDFARQAAREASRHDFDLIHAHDWMTALAGLEIRKQSGKPLIFHVHSLTYDRAGAEERGWIHEIEKNILKSADLVIAVSHYTRQIAIDHYEAPPAKVVVVHNGAAPIRAFRSPKPFSEKLVFFLGRLTGQKAPRDFLKIAQKVLASDQKVRFALAGTGEQLHSLMAGAVRLGIQKNLHFTGFLNRRRVYQLLSMADAYCMPSRSEPFGLSALEAAQFGVPVVLSKQSGVAEILPAARIAEAGDIETMADHLIEILSGETTPQPTQVRSWQDASEETLAFYQNLLPDRSVTGLTR